ncbi:hypothetical protein PspTeo4_13560 [Pseudomonas sp. Teo4]|nr:hypothetical protein [Pseudomonas sp. Teo4]
MHPAPVDVAILEHVGVVGDVFLGPGPQGEGRRVLQQLQATARHRERCAAGLADHAFAVVHQLGQLGILAGRLAHRIVEAKITVAGVDRHLECRRVQLEQGLLPVGKRVGVLGQVVGSDHEQRFFIGIGVDRMMPGAFERHLGRRAQPLAGERRDTAVGVALGVGAQAGQVLAQALDILRRGLHRATGRAQQQRQSQTLRGKTAGSEQATAGRFTVGHSCSPWLPIAVAQYRQALGPGASSARTNAFLPRHGRAAR